MAALVAISMAVGCTCASDPPEPEEPSGETSDGTAPADSAAAPADIARLAEGAERAAASDIDGDGQLELVLAEDRTLRVVALDGEELGRVDGPGAIQVLEVADLDGDDRAEVLCGWGRSRERPEAPIQLSVYRFDGDDLTEERVHRTETDRADVVAMVPVPGASAPELVVAWFDSKYMVQLARARRDGGRWTVDEGSTIRMATSLAVGDVDGNGTDDLVVGRLYGDSIDEPGDAFILQPDGSRTALPVTRGVRALALADLDGDGAGEVLAADGWHKSYADHAEALLTLIDVGEGTPEAERLDRSEDEFVLWDVTPADLDGDGQLEIVTRGNAHVRVLDRQDGRWSASTVQSACDEAAAADLTAAPGSELLLLCSGGAELVEWHPER